MHGAVPEINFQEIRPQAGRQDEGFEEFCRQLAGHTANAPEKSTFIRYRGAGGDGGVECVWQLPSGEEWGWQAKYFFELNKQQLDKSVSTALTIHPNLTRYFICIPFDLTGPTGRPGRSQHEKYEDYKAHWVKLAEDHGMSVEFVLWGKSELIDQLLSIDPDLSQTRYWFSEEFFNDQWFKNHLSDAAKAAEPRYTPELTVDVPIHQAFEALGRTPVWEGAVRKLDRDVRTVKDRWSRTLSPSQDPAVSKLPASAKEPVESLVPMLFEVSQLLDVLVASRDETD